MFSVFSINNKNKKRVSSRFPCASIYASVQVGGRAARAGVVYVRACVRPPMLCYAQKISKVAIRRRRTNKNSKPIVTVTVTVHRAYESRTRNGTSRGRMTMTGKCYRFYRGIGYIQCRLEWGEETRTTGIRL